MADTVVMIDVENTSLSLRKYRRCMFDAQEVIEKAGGWARIREVVAYADFLQVPDAIGRHLGHHSIRCRHVARTNGSCRKDLVDVVLSLEMIEAVLTEPGVNRVVLVAGDADYIPAVSRARQARKQVSLWLSKARLATSYVTSSQTTSRFLRAGHLFARFKKRPS